MKTKLFNKENIKEEEINDKVIRVKALILNDNNELLLGSAFKTLQFPGGHLENNESLNEALIREVKEETGISIKGEYEPFLSLKYYLKDYPVIGNNRSLEIYYFYILTNEPYNLDNINLDDQERNGEFHLLYVPLKKVKKLLKKSIPDNKINKIIVREMLIALKEFKKVRKNG